MLSSLRILLACSAVGFAAVESVLLLANGPELSGAEGWVGTGLLGSVLGWLLLKYIPDKDKQFKTALDEKDARFLAYIEARDKQIEQLVEKKDRQVAEVVSAFKADLKEERNWREATMSANREQFEKERDSRHQQGNNLVAALYETKATIAENTVAIGQNAAAVEQLREMLEQRGYFSKHEFPDSEHTA